MDTDGDGAVSLEEFSAGFEQWQSSCGTAPAAHHVAEMMLDGCAISTMQETSTDVANPGAAEKATLKVASVLDQALEFCPTHLRSVLRAAALRLHLSHLDEAHALLQRACKLRGPHRRLALGGCEAVRIAAEYQAEMLQDAPTNPPQGSY